MAIKGNRYGIHRVISPAGVLTQAAQTIDNDMSKLYSNEIICDVSALNIDSASFTQIEQACGGDLAKIEQMILDIVNEKGKMQNPVTGSGGMFIGTVAYIGEDLQDRDLKVGDKVASLVSLSLTPLKIEKIHAIHSEIDRVDVTAKAVLFESGIYAKLPDDMSEALALAALDVAGAPAQTAKLVKEGDSVLILGAGGKSGILCCYEAMKQAGPNGRVVCVEYAEAGAQELRDLGLGHEVIVGDATHPGELLELALAANGGKEYDCSISCVNVPNCEMSAILPVKDGGKVYFFSMATNFAKAALGAEGVGKDIDMLVGNGYTAGHADLTLEELRENSAIRKLFDTKYS
jgi:NADPH:quinone reductase and related Zn-dependent oxidoreductases